MQGDSKRRRGCPGRASTRALAAGAVVLSLSHGFAWTASAQTPSEIATAKQWFADALVLEEKGEFPAALDLFRRAQDVKKTPQIVYHVGFCESRTGALVLALVDLDRAATLARGAHADNVVTAAQDELAELKMRIPTLEVREGQDAGAEGAAKATRFIVDGNSVALSMLRTAMPIDPGEHTVAVEYASGVTASKTLTLAEHDVRRVDLSPPAEPTPAPMPSATAATGSPAQAAPSAPVTSKQGSSVLPATLVGVGTALGVGGAALFIVARVKEGSLNEVCPTHTDCPLSRESDYETARTLNGLGLGLGIAGIAAAGVGVSMLVLRPSAKTSLAITPWGARVTGRF